MAANTNLAALCGSYAYHDTLKGVHYGPGCVRTALPKLLSILGGSKAFIVTGNSLREKTNVVSDVEAILKGNDAFAATFSEIGQHAPVQGIIRGVEAFRAAGADIIVSIGGGSPIDAAKAMIHRLHQENGGFINNIAIPTTLSAAEYRGGAGYSDEQGNKVSVSHPMLAPAGIILDAELTLATPEELWLSTGIRALDHAVEGLYNPSSLYPIKVFCYAALSDLFKYLPKSKAQPGDLEARQRLMIASWMSLWPLKIEKYGSLGLSHSLGHKLGATYGIPHGITSCLTLASVVGLKADIASPEDKAALAEALFYLREPTTGSVEGDVKRFGNKIDELVRGLASILQATAAALVRQRIRFDEVGSRTALALSIATSRPDLRFGSVLQRRATSSSSNAIVVLLFNRSSQFAGQGGRAYESQSEIASSGLLLAASPVSLTSPVLSRSMSQQTTTTTVSKGDDPRSTEKNAQSLGSDNSRNHHHDHSHSHSIFHSHSRDDHDHSQSAEQIVHIFEGKGDRGSRITLLGLLVNIVLTSAKGFAGWYMHSASLLADAGHSFSDLLGDFVTLACWKLSRRPPSERYPYGFAKFETLGTTTVSILLVGGALGIGFHSYHLLMEALSETVSTFPPGLLHDILQQVAVASHHVPSVGHAHSHVDVLDPNAAWFAAVSVLCKEWLYRVTKKVADEEHSPVLYANAVHHRSDAYSSFVALFAILGSSSFPSLPLDPLGGLLVSFVILRQGVELLGGAYVELTDAGISTSSRDKLMRALDPLVFPGNDGIAVSEDACILAIKALRAKRAGSLMYVDLTVDVPRSMTVLATSELESKIAQRLRDAMREVSEVRVRFQPVKGSSP
ncbi:hypothetical protein JVU11DRAFT_2400 [Chiua virens]|nr:hypothetical protein JVU11DRAFT_2400 [Chiua virens]